MDEEDGKTGARARQSGQLNALQGVPAQSLRPFPSTIHSGIRATPANRILSARKRGTP
jgi:hypothetical protein